MYAYFQLPEISKALREIGLLNECSLQQFIYDNIPPFKDGDKLKIILLDGAELDLIKFFPGKFVSDLACDENESYVDISEYDLSYFLTNVEDMNYNYAKRKFIYIPPTNVNHVSDKIVRTNGDITSIVSDLSKLMEVIILFITDNLSTEQKQKLIDTISSINKDNLLINLKYKEDPVEFVNKFLDRQKDITTIMKDFYKTK